MLIRSKKARLSYISQLLSDGVEKAIVARRLAQTFDYDIEDAEADVERVACALMLKVAYQQRIPSSEALEIRRREAEKPRGIWRGGKDYISPEELAEEDRWVLFRGKRMLKQEAERLASQVNWPF